MSLSLCIYLGTQLFNFKNLNLGFVKPASMNAGGCPRTPSNVVCGRSRMPATLPKTADCFWGTAQLGRPPPPRFRTLEGAVNWHPCARKDRLPGGQPAEGREGVDVRHVRPGEHDPLELNAVIPLVRPPLLVHGRAVLKRNLKKICCLSTFDENATTEVAEKNGCRRKKTGRRPGTKAISRFRAPSAVHQKCQKMHCQLFLNFLLVFFKFRPRSSSQFVPWPALGGQSKKAVLK